MRSSSLALSKPLHNWALCCRQLLVGFGVRQGLHGVHATVFRFPDHLS